jgi:hypothetical protein
LRKRIYGEWAKASPDVPKAMQKATEEHNKWNIGFNAVVRNTQFSNYFSVTFKRQGEKRLQYFKSIEW